MSKLVKFFVSLFRTKNGAGVLSREEKIKVFTRNEIRKAIRQELVDQDREKAGLARFYIRQLGEIDRASGLMPDDIDL